MPSIKDKSTVEAIAREFCSNGRNKRKAMKAVGYSDNYAEHRADMVLSNVGVKQAIARIDGKTAKKLDLSRESQHRKLEQSIAMAIATNSSSGMTAAIREQNEMLGYHREKAANPEKMDELRARMGAEEELARLAHAKQRTKALSESKPAFPRINKEIA